MMSVEKVFVKGKFSTHLNDNEFWWNFNPNEKPEQNDDYLMNDLDRSEDKERKMK